MAAVLLAYGPALRNGFVWDDTALVLRDPLIRSPWLLVEGFRHFLFIDATASDFYRPLQRAVFTLDYALAGLAPWIFHLTCILIHAGVALALFEFGRRLFGYRRTAGTAPVDANRRDARATIAALAAALIWSVHPVHSSAVIYVSGLADPLAALLGFAGLALLLRKRLIAAGIFLGAAVFAKESGVFALLVGLGFAWGLSRTDSARFAPARIVRFARTAVPALVLLAVYLGLRFSAERIPPPQPEPVPAAVRPILALRAVAEYAQILVAPVTLRMERDVATRTGGEMEATLAAARVREWQTLAGALLVAGAVIWYRRPGAGAKTRRQCLLAVAVAYLPMSNLFSLNATVAEHWIYVPSAFLFLAVGASLVEVKPKTAASHGGESNSVGVGSHAGAVFGGALLAAVVLALGIRTAIRCGDWRAQESFLQSTIASGGDSDRMLTNRATLRLTRGDVPGAIADFREALKRKPDQRFAMLGLAGALIRQHSWAEARQWLDRCERIPLVRAEALVDRAVLEYQETGRDRVDLLKQAAEVNPHFWPWRKRYIGHLIERGDAGEGMRELRSVLTEQPFRAEAWAMLGELLRRTGAESLADEAFAAAASCDVHWNAPEKGVSPGAARASSPAN